MSEDLKPCPHCGGEARIYEHVNKWFGETWHVECLEEYCGCCTCHHETEANAVRVWNTRTDMADAINVELGMARSANDDATAEWIAGFHFAWKRVKAVLGEQQ